MSRPARAHAAAGLATLLAAAPARAAGGGLEILPDPPRLLVLLVLFLLLIPLLDRLVFRPLLGVLEERERRIEGARLRAAELAREAADLDRRHAGAVQEVRAAAHGERSQEIEQARRENQAALAEARLAAEREIAGTRADVAAAVEVARARLRGEVEPLAREVAERLLGRSLA
jgi:F-type H+-transporting ATPase subunit b